MTSQLETLKEKQSRLEARILQLEAVEKTKEKRQETRRQILVGNYYLSKIRQENRWDELKTALEPIITRASDRKLFDLPLSNCKKKTSHSATVNQSL